MEKVEQGPEQEPTIKLEVYSAGNIPDEKTAEDISNLFVENYPTMYPGQQRQSDLKRYDSPEKIQKQIEDGNFFITAIMDDKMVGMTKFRQESRTNSPDCEEWLGSWIMVDKPYRQSGIAEQLFQKNLETLKDIKMKSGNKTFLVIDVHRDNTASVNFCRKMGFEELDGKSPEYFLFRKEIVD